MIKLKFVGGVGEIETVLNQHEAVEKCVVVGYGDISGNKRLIAYGVSRRSELKGDNLIFMAFILTKPFPRLWSLAAGVAMIVTDLHGDWEAYQRYRNRFIDLQAKGWADCLILTGDLIHQENAHLPDKSLEIVLDIMALQVDYGEAIICLTGNHEISHIYGITLAKQNQVYTPAFEKALTQSQQRAEIIALFEGLPFCLRTQAGVTMTHAGAALPLAAPDSADKIFNWSHRHLLDWADEMMVAQGLEALRAHYVGLHQLPYDLLAKHYLAVAGPDDPRYNDLLRGFVISGHPMFEQLLWPTLFTRCEEEYGQSNYAAIVTAMLQTMSVDFAPQQVLVSGHMTLRGGYQMVTKQHLRLASAYHATPREAGVYLLLDTGQPIREIKDLLPGIGSVFK
jgi:hypothetical protein